MSATVRVGLVLTHGKFDVVFGSRNAPDSRSRPRDSPSFSLDAVWMRLGLRIHRVVCDERIPFTYQRGIC